MARAHDIEFGARAAKKKTKQEFVDPSQGSFLNRGRLERGLRLWRRSGSFGSVRRKVGF